MFIYKKIRRSIIRKADDESVLERLMSFIEEHYGLFAAAVFAALSNAGDSITTSAVAEVMNAYRSAAERYRTDNAPETRPFAPGIHTSAPNSGAPPRAAEGPIPIEHILANTVTGNVIDELVRAFEDDDIQTAYESALSHGITSVSNDLKLPPPKQIQRLLPSPSFHYNEFYERWCSEHCGELIIEISDSQRENVRQIINNALQNGHSVNMAAKEIRRTVGLTERQTWANIRYSDRMYEELRKAHPNMRSAALRKLADEAADKYAQTQRRKRSIDIARTELAKAQMQASLEYIKWAQELGLIQDIHGEWVTSGKSNVCSVCRKLNHKAVDLTKDPLPPLHPRCACGIRFVSGTAESEISELRGIKPSDYAQYIRYRDRLGENNVGSIDSFIDLKYNNSDGWAELKYIYRNINGRPIEYARIDYELKKHGITGKGKACPVEPVNVKGWRPHAEKRLIERGISQEQALEYMNNAIVMMKKYPEPNTQLNFYSEDGVIGILQNNGKVCTTLSKDDFRNDTKRIIEVSNKWLRS